MLSDFLKLYIFSKTVFPGAELATMAFDVKSITIWAGHQDIA
jgi:hypothetical protein